LARPAAKRHDVDLLGCSTKVAEQRRSTRELAGRRPAPRLGEFLVVMADAAWLPGQLAGLLRPWHWCGTLALSVL